MFFQEKLYGWGPDGLPGAQKAPKEQGEAILFPGTTLGKGEQQPSPGFRETKKSRLGGYQKGNPDWTEEPMWLGDGGRRRERIRALEGEGVFRKKFSSGRKDAEKNCKLGLSYSMKRIRRKFHGHPLNRG